MTLQDITVIAKRFGESATISPEMWACLTHLLDRKEINAIAECYKDSAILDREAAKYGEFERIENTLHEFCAREGLKVDRQSAHYYLLMQQALLARSKASESIHRRATGDLEDLTEELLLSQAVPGPSPEPASAIFLSAASPAVDEAVKEKKISLAEACQLFIEEKSETEGAWDRNATLPQVRTTLKTFCDLVGGDLPVSRLNRDILNDVKKRLAMLPKQTLKQYAGMTVLSQLAMKIPEDHKIQKGTLNNQLIWIKAFCDWAVVNDYMGKSITKGLVIKRSVIAKHRRSDCDPYSTPEVQTIFSSDHFTYNSIRPERFWGPLIAAHTSGRLNEIGQLLVDDICHVGGVLCFKMQIDDEQGQGPKKKKLKTQSSKRTIPVHKILLELGFEKYVNEIRAAGEDRLFPKLPAAKRGHGVELGKWYGREITAKLFPGKNRRKVFNSFRHTVEDQFKNIWDMRDSMQSYLTGHATGALDFDLYGSDPEAANLRIFIDRIDYGLDLEGLKRKMANPVMVRRGPAPERREGRR